MPAPVTHPELGSGQEAPSVSGRIPGPESRTWLLRAAHVSAPMGPKRLPITLADGRRRPAPPSGVVFSKAYGCNVWDPDRNRFVDLAAGFGSLLLGHGHRAVRRALDVQGDRLLQAMGDLYPADAKIGLLQQLVELFPAKGAQGILGQSGADAVTAAFKTAQLHTGKSGVLAFDGAYHGLSYAPLAACGLRDSYRTPFSGQLGRHVTFLPYPDTEATPVLQRLEAALKTGVFGAVLVEPIAGRGGVRPLPAEALRSMRELTTRHGALLIVDEIWTGLGRAGFRTCCEALGVIPDLLCLGKGLGGGLPLSACLGSREVMASWSRDEEVVHTATFAGSPLSCATALALLDVLRREKLAERSRSVGAWFKQELQDALVGVPAEVRGSGLMLGIDLGALGAARGGTKDLATRLMFSLLQSGYITSTGGGDRDVLVLTPPLVIDKRLLEGCIPVLVRAIQEL